MGEVGFHNPQLLTMPFEIVNEIMKRETLGVAETDLLEFLVRWSDEQELNNDKETVKRQATQLAQHLKLRLVQPESYFNVLKPSGWFSTEVLWDILTEMINSNRRYPGRVDDEDPKYRPRKPGPKTLKPKRKVAIDSLPSIPIAILGMEAAGKTVLLYKLKLGEVVTTIPSTYRTKFLGDPEVAVVIATILLLILELLHKFIILALLKLIACY